jgi:hypothetical protein
MLSSDTGGKKLCWYFKEANPSKSPSKCKEGAEQSYLGIHCSCSPTKALRIRLHWWYHEVHLPWCFCLGMFGSHKKGQGSLWRDIQKHRECAWIFPTLLPWPLSFGSILTANSRWQTPQRPVRWPGSHHPWALGLGGTSTYLSGTPGFLLTGQESPHLGLLHPVAPNSTADCGSGGLRSDSLGLWPSTQNGGALGPCLILSDNRIVW